MFTHNECTKQITLEAGLFAFAITSALSITASVIFFMRGDGFMEIDDRMMGYILVMPWLAGVIFFNAYSRFKGASKAQCEMNNQKDNSLKFAFKNMMIISLSGGIGISVFNYFFTFKNNVEMTLLMGFILVIALPALLYFSDLRRVRDDEHV
ncbi:MAG TPA: hypothetical protein VEC36_12525 [Patescibacteria group bacterium]|nr:hypothetical protein [Patescibacteria group bacterium]